MLQSWFSSAGCEVEVGRRHLSDDQQDGFAYPALHKWQDMQAAKGLWIGTTNYSDPLSEDFYDHKVVHIGPRGIDETNEIMPQTFKLIGRFHHPDVTVNGWQASELDIYDIPDEIDSRLPADRMILNEVNTAIGISVTRRVYAFSNPHHDNYFIYDYVFENTGFYDMDGNRHQLTLTDVIFFFQYRWAMTKYASSWQYGWAPQTTSWGENTVNEILHPTYGDEYNAIYSWHGLSSRYEGNNIGAPNIGNSFSGIAADGSLGAPQFPGVVSLHADQSAADKSNDPNQFTSAPFFSSNDAITFQNSQFDANKMNSEYQYMNMGLPDITHAEEIDYPHNPGWQDAPFDYTKDAEDIFTYGSGHSQGIGYGPYNLTPGASIRIVLAEACGSLDWQMRQEIGENWYMGNSPYNLPDGSTTDDRDTYKDAWVFTGKDSLFQSFDRAIETWNNNLVVDPTPPPPDKFTVTSGGDRIALTWSNNAQDYSHFAGYEIYRQVENPDTSFNMIYKCGNGTDSPIVNHFDDFDVQPETNYYYYIVSYDNGSVNTISPSTPISSSLFWTKTNEPAYLLRAPGKRLENIVIVPNPLYMSNLNSQADNKVMFFNLPPKCNIRIFTERGDLITTIRHNNNCGDDYWNVSNNDEKLVVSGIYIASIEVTEDYHIDNEHSLRKGNTIAKKFLIIR